MDIRNAKTYIEQFCKIRTKDGRIVPFRLNQPQQKLYDIIKAENQAGKPIRIIILKARQMGFSTLTEGLIFQRTATKELTNSMIVTHVDDATTQLFNMSKLMYDQLPAQLKPMVKSSNAKELNFQNPSRDAGEREANPGLRSSIRCATAGGRGIGRSMTLQNVHASEFAFWPGDPEESMLGLLQAVPSEPGTMVIIESTANGFDAFKRRWDAAVAGESDFVPVFFGWQEMDEYRMPVPTGTTFSTDERAVQKSLGIDDQQLYWRRWCIANNCGGDLNKFHQEYPATPDEAFISSGTPVFDNAAIMEQRERIRKEQGENTGKRGRFAYRKIYSAEREAVSLTDIRWVDEADGPIRIYQEPERGTPYVLGGDTAGEGSDWFAAHVIDNTSGRLCAVLHQKFDEDIYAEQVYCLGLHYNRALVGLEINYSTHPTRRLQDMAYPRLYVRQSFDDYERGVAKKYGFATTGITRPVILAQLVEVMRDNPGCVCDYDTLGEMLVFCKNAAGRPEALPGEHDDLVMSLAITYGIRDQQSYVRELPAGPENDWDETMLEDYRRASPEEKEYLRRIWGTPRRPKR